MLELISVVALAAIGVAFTSYQGEQEGSSLSSHGAAPEGEDQAEPLGIFGYDVGRRLRNGMKFFGARSAEDQATLDEAEALAARLSASLEREEEALLLEAPEIEDPQQTDRLIRDAVHQQGWDHDVSESDVDAVLAGDPSLTEDGFEAPLEEAWAASLGDMMEEYGEETPVPLTHEDLLAAEDAPLPAPAAAPRAALNAPVIHDFDPDRDQIVLEYRPEEVGNGRVGIITDDRHPGAALITLGGKVVAIVDGGDGRVTVDHVELIREEARTSAA